MIGPKRQMHHRFGNGRLPGTFSAWTMAIVFVTVAMISFAVDQAVVLAPTSTDESGFQPPSILHPVQLIESLIDAASDPAARAE